MKNFIIVFLLTLCSSLVYGSECPNFTGRYLSEDGKKLLEFKQDHCESLAYRLTLSNNSKVQQTYIIDAEPHPDELAQGKDIYYKALFYGDAINIMHSQLKIINKYPVFIGKGTTAYWFQGRDQLVRVDVPSPLDPSGSETRERYKAIP
jgi:hypothetical protein